MELGQSKIKSVIFFSNGNTAVFNKGGQQVAKLQKSWFKMFLEFLDENGINPIDIEEFKMPNALNAKPFRIEDGFNWEIF